MCYDYQKQTCISIDFIFRSRENERTNLRAKPAFKEI